MIEYKPTLTIERGNGFYNSSDLNRVESWCRFLADELNAVGYNISINTKTNWAQTDMRTASEMERIRTNIKAIMNGYHYITNIENNAENFDYIKANNWERILFEIWNLMIGMQDWYVYGGVANGGQNRLWQHRYRDFYYLLVGTTWNELGGAIWNDFNEETWNSF